SGIPVLFEFADPITKSSGGGSDVMNHAGSGARAPTFMPDASKKTEKTSKNMSDLVKGVILPKS
ncbi:MAG: hypothetical protein IJ231_08375, partial [Clostridia bacterium]|nr:hypothetical protein [Clostridia bacterium]